MGDPGETRDEDFPAGVGGHDRNTFDLMFRMYKSVAAGNPGSWPFPIQDLWLLRILFSRVAALLAGHVIADVQIRLGSTAASSPLAR
jgi:hypothetical protein